MLRSTHTWRDARDAIFIRRFIRYVHIEVTIELHSHLSQCRRYASNPRSPGIFQSSRRVQTQRHDGTMAIRVNYGNFKFFAPRARPHSRATGAYVTLRKLISTTLAGFSRKNERGVHATGWSSYSSVGSSQLLYEIARCLQFLETIHETDDGGGKLGGDDLTLASPYQSDAERASRRPTNP